VLQLPTELPAVTTGNPRRLKFYVTPLTGKGLLTHQIREALKALERQSGGETVLKIRAFVAGSGDVRRVRDLVSEEFHRAQAATPRPDPGALPAACRWKARKWCWRRSWKGTRT